MGGPGDSMVAGPVLFHWHVLSVAPGSPADLVVWDYVPPTPILRENIWGHILFGLVNARAVEVLIAGRHRLAGGMPTDVDEGEILARCRDAAARLWERF